MAPSSSRSRFILAALVTIVLCGALVVGVLALSGRVRDATGSASSPVPSQSTSHTRAGTADEPTSAPPVESPIQPAPADESVPVGAPGVPDQCGTIAAPANAALVEQVAAVEAEYGTPVSVAWLDPAQGIVTAGSLGTVAAWSTSKVPLSVAVVQAGNGDTYASSITAAIQWSDNSAADALWRSLGDTDTARAAAVTAILRQAGDDSTTVPSSQLYPPYSVFGQTIWSTADQVLFAQQLPCLEGSAQVVAAMGSVDASQRWGLGRLDGAVFKGGWGPGSGGYTTRQFGWYSDAAGNRVVVAMATQAGSFEAGTAILDALAAALTT